jgi:hypothetical protein
MVGETFERLLVQTKNLKYRESIPPPRREENIRVSSGPGKSESVKDFSSYPAKKAHGATAEGMKEKIDHKFIEVLSSETSSLDEKRIAAQTLGELGTPLAVDCLIGMLDTTDSALAQSCSRALVKITFHDFGLSKPRWLYWWEANRLKHRVEWAIDSLDCEDERIRETALENLKKAVGDPFDWPCEKMNDMQWRELKRDLRNWWKHSGSILYRTTEKE